MAYGIENCKVYVGKYSTEVQKKLFDLGFRWKNTYDTEIRHLESPFIYIGTKELEYGNSLVKFNNDENKEITIKSILSIPSPFNIGDLIYIPNYRAYGRICKMDDITMYLDIMINEIGRVIYMDDCNSFPITNCSRISHLDDSQVSYFKEKIEFSKKIIKELKV